jgi:hypothetical protein
LTPPIVPHPLRRYIEVIAVLAGLLGYPLTGCAPEPLPEPPVPPIPPRAALPPRQEHRLDALYEAAAARVTAYRALPVCAASGPLACCDPVKVRDASRLARAARIALGRARRGTVPGWLARTRVAAFEAAALRLTGETP